MVEMNISAGLYRRDEGDAGDVMWRERYPMSASWIHSDSAVY